jgi:hypothetical protein
VALLYGGLYGAVRIPIFRVMAEIDEQRVIDLEEAVTRHDLAALRRVAERRRERGETSDQAGKIIDLR